MLYKIFSLFESSKQALSKTCILNFIQCINLSAFSVEYDKGIINSEPSLEVETLEKDACQVIANKKKCAAKGERIRRLRIIMSFKTLFSTL